AGTLVRDRVPVMRVAGCESAHSLVKVRLGGTWAVVRSSSLLVPSIPHGEGLSSAASNFLGPGNYPKWPCWLSVGKVPDCAHARACGHASRVDVHAVGYRALVLVLELVLVVWLAGC